MRNALIVIAQEAAELACIGAFLAAIVLGAEHVEATAMLRALV